MVSISEQCMRAAEIAASLQMCGVAILQSDILAAVAHCTENPELSKIAHELSETGN